MAKTDWINFIPKRLNITSTEYTEKGIWTSELSNKSAEEIYDDLSTSLEELISGVQIRKNLKKTDDSYEKVYYNITIQVDRDIQINA